MRKLTAADYLLSLAASWGMGRSGRPGAFGAGIEVYGAEVVVPRCRTVYSDCSAVSRERSLGA
ncbi:hypothetical protein GCM10010522_44180 [Kribbella solani]